MLKKYGPGLMDRWMDGWMDGRAGLRIAYSNQITHRLKKLALIFFNFLDTITRKKGR